MAYFLVRQRAATHQQSSRACKVEGIPVIRPSRINLNSKDETSRLEDCARDTFRFELEKSKGCLYFQWSNTSGYVLSTGAARG